MKIVMVMMCSAFPVVLVQFIGGASQIDSSALKEKWTEKVKWPLYDIDRDINLCEPVRGFVPPFPSNISVYSTVFSLAAEDEGDVFMSSADDLTDESDCEVSLPKVSVAIPCPQAYLI
jgi:hypothetical protein